MPESERSPAVLGEREDRLKAELQTQQPEGCTSNTDEEKLAEAFPALDASEEEVRRLAEVPPDAKLLAVTPLPPAIDFEELEEEVSRTRILLIRGAAAIPLTAIIAIGGALLFHTLMVGGFLLALYFSVNHMRGAGTEVSAGPDGGGTPGGYMAAADVPEGPPTLANTMESAMPGAVIPPMPTLPSLPESSEMDSVADRVAEQELGGNRTDAGMIGIPAGDRIGTVHVAPPPRRVQDREANRVPANNTLVVAPPPAEPKKVENQAGVEAGKTILASAGSKTGSPTSPKRGKGRGGEDDFGDETIIPLTKGDGGGGNGSGPGRGGGRGGSGANNPEPTILEWSVPEFSAAVRMNPPSKSSKFKVTVLASGEVGGIELVQSCGQAGLDAMCQSSLQNAKYRPAYRAGKPYEAIKEVEFEYTK